MRKSLNCMYSILLREADKMVREFVHQIPFSKMDAEA